MAQPQVPHDVSSSRERAEELMKDADTYRQFAEECRRLAATMKADADKKTLLEMAAAWDKQAQQAEARMKGE
jgi:hypothetical protein